jgi:membrane-bound serine protease (ClpP class)
MKSSLRDIVIVLYCLLIFTDWIKAEEPNNTTVDLQQVKAAVIVCEGLIDNGLYKSIQRRTKIALGEGANYLIFQISTYGGILQSADDIAKYLILDIPQMSDKAHTVAYITTEAISAGAMISVSCQDIIMRENTTIGDCAPIVMGGKLEGVEREKTESFTRAAFTRAAEANGYPVALLKAMVTMQTEVFRVKNMKTGEFEFFESEELPKDPNVYDLDNKELIVKDDEILTLTASSALEYGVARAVVQDLSGALDFLAERDGVNFTGEPMLLETTWSEEMVRWINSPVVMAILVMLALLGAYVEFNTPGLGLPGLVAVICVIIIIGSKYLIGLANWVEVALFVVGIILLLIEFLVLPGFGIAGISGIVCIFAGLFGMLIKNPPDKLPWPSNPVEWGDFTQGVIGLSLGFGGFIILAWLLSKYMPKIPFLGGLILVPTSAKQGGTMQVSMTKPVESEIVGVNIGDIGEVISTLRPTGKARFGDAIVDVVAEGDFLNIGTKVKIIEIHGNRVVVKAALIKS